MYSLGLLGGIFAAGVVVSLVFALYITFAPRLRRKCSMFLFAVAACQLLCFGALYASLRLGCVRKRPLPYRGSMDCGAAPLCGLLVLSSGLGSEMYGGGHPNIHGLWPQVYEGNHGNSECIAPYGKRDWRALRSSMCFSDAGLARHEWKEHGVCAGARDINDFVDQVCRLADRPLQVMRRNRGNLHGMQNALQRAGYPMTRRGPGAQKQIFLSACAGHDGRWRLAPESDFDMLCGGCDAKGTTAGNQFPWKLQGASKQLAVAFACSALLSALVGFLGLWWSGSRSARAFAAAVATGLQHIELREARPSRGQRQTWRR